MTFDQIERALGQHLADMASAPAIAWPNKAFKIEPPYLEFRHSPATREDDTLDCIGTIQTGLVLITAVMPRDDFATDGNVLAQRVADRFPKGFRITAGTGVVLISAPSALGAPFVDGSLYRQPVIVRYLTEGDAATSGPTIGGVPVGNIDVSGPGDGIELIGDELRVNISDLPLAD